MTPLLHDEVWRQLDPYAGRVSRRTLVRSWAVGIVALLVLTTAAWVWESGAARPRLIADDGGWVSSLNVVDANPRHAPADPDLSQQVRIENHGWLAVRIAGVGADGPGIHLRESTVDQRLTPQTPFVLKRGGTAAVTMSYRITDCTAVPADPWPIPVRLLRPWGIQTVHVWLPPLRAHPVYSGWSITTRDDPKAVEWQRWLADDVCNFSHRR
jgi:hypothetical protein